MNVNGTLTSIAFFRDAHINERCDTIIEDQTSSIANELTGNITIVIIYSVKTEYTKYKCDLEEEKTLQDTFIYQVYQRLVLFLLCFFFRVLTFLSFAIYF